MRKTVICYQNVYPFETVQAAGNNGGAVTFTAAQHSIGVVTVGAVMSDLKLQCILVPSISVCFSGSA
jgi:hypothetical protein